MTAKQIVRTMLSERLIGPKDFFSPSRTPHLSNARIEVATALNEMGYANAQISRALGRNHSTVVYYLKSDFRAAKRNEMRERMRVKRSRS